MIILGGVHGVGKSYFCKILKQQIRINTYSASTLIADQKNSTLTKNKFTKNITENQQHLITAIEAIEQRNTNFLLDAHFCLLDNNGAIVKIPQNIFRQLKPQAILILTEDPQIIAERRKARDGILLDAREIEMHQKEECTHSLTVANALDIPHRVYRGKEQYADAITFIEAQR